MKKDTQDKAPRKGRRPFFARLLEEQELEQAAGGKLAQTQKYPSDNEDGGVITTLKYPSDSEDGGCT